MPVDRPSWTENFVEALLRYGLKKRYVNTVVPAAPNISSITVTPMGPVRVGDVLTAVVNLTWTPTGSLTYQWRVGGVDQPGETNPTYTTTAAGDVTVYVVATNTEGSDNLESDTVRVNSEVTIAMMGDVNSVGGHSDTSSDAGLLGAWYEYRNSGGATTIPTTGFGPALGVTQSLASASQFVQLADHSVSGATLSDWASTHEATWYAVIDAMTSGDTPTDVIITHGEEDAKTLSDADAYEANLLALISRIRALYGIAVRIHLCSLRSLPLGTYPYWATVQAAQAAVVAADPLVFAINPAGFPKVDPVSYTGEGQRDLGQAYATSIVDEGGAITILPRFVGGTIDPSSPLEGQTLTATMRWAGTYPQSYASQWSDDGVELSGETSETLVAAPEGTVELNQDATNSVGTVSGNVSTTVGAVASLGSAIKRKALGDDYIITAGQVTTVSDTVAFVLFELDDFSGSDGTIIDFGIDGSTGSPFRLSITGESSLQLEYRTNSGLQTLALATSVDTFYDGAQHLVWIRIQDGTPGTVRMGIAATGGDEATDSRPEGITSGLTSAAAALFADITTPAREMAGAVSAVVIDGWITDTRVDSLHTSIAGVSGSLSWVVFLSELDSHMTAEGSTYIWSPIADIGDITVAGDVTDNSGTFSHTLVSGINNTAGWPYAEGFSQSTLSLSGGTHIQGSSTYAVSDTMTLLWYGNVQSLGILDGFLAGAVPDSGEFGVAIRYTDSATIQAIWRDGGDNLVTQDHTVENISTADRDLHFVAANPSWGVRVGMAHMTAQSYYSENSTTVAAGTSPHGPGFGSPHTSTSQTNPTLRGVTYENAWALQINRDLTDDEWERARRGDWFWAYGDASVAWIVVPTTDLEIGETISDSKVDQSELTMVVDGHQSTLSGQISGDDVIPPTPTAPVILDISIDWTDADADTDPNVGDTFFPIFSTTGDPTPVLSYEWFLGAVSQGTTTSLVVGSDGSLTVDIEATNSEGTDSDTSAAVIVLASASGLAPDEVSGLYLWEDGFDSATYNGSNELTGITDKGPNGIDITPDSGTGPTPTSYEVDGVPTDLPGPFTVALPTNHPESATGLAKVFTDITVMAIVPTITSQTNGTAMFSMYGDDGGGANYQLVLGQGPTPDDIQAFMQGGSIEIPVDWSTGNNGSHAIVFFRRQAGVDLYLDSWYDNLSGGGITKPAQVTYGSDPTTGTMTIDSVAFGGRGSITQVWVGNPIHMVAVWDEYVSDGDIVSLAQWAGSRLGFTGIS